MSFRIKPRHTAILATLLPSLALAQTATFDLMIGDKKIGKDTYTLTKSKQGYKLMSRYGYRIGAADANALTEFKYSDAYAYIEGSSTNPDNQLMTSLVPNKTHTELTISQFQAGNGVSTIAPIKPDLVILPNFDAGAAQVLLLLATTHPTPSNLYNLFIPSNSPSGGGGGRGRGAAPAAAATTTDEALPPGNNAYDALWGKGHDLTATLDDKPITVHTYLFAFGKFRWILFADADNNLMQVNVSLLHATYIRAKFKLDPPK